MSGRLAPIVVVGIGNVLLRDDGVGPRVVGALAELRAIDRRALPAATRLVDGGTAGIALGDALDGARALLVVDAVDVGRAPGEVMVLREDEIHGLGGRRTASRSGGVGELVALARLAGWVTGPVALVGVQAAEVSFELGLSPAVEAAIPAAVEAARVTLHALDADAAARDARAARTRGRANPAGLHLVGVGPVPGAEVHVPRTPEATR